MSSCGKHIALDFRSWLTGKELNVVFCCCSPSDLCIVRCFVVHHGCIQWLFKLLQPSCQLKPIRPFSSAINKAFQPKELPLSGCFLFFSWCILCKLQRLLYIKILADSKILILTHLAPTTMQVRSHFPLL